MLAAAAEKARASGRNDVAAYLHLKASNDLIRQASVNWMLDTLIEHAASANRSNLAIAIERVEPYSFSHLGANLVGSCLSLRYGVRCLTVETGWTRTPADGFLRGGGLALARFRHFGVPKAGAILSLTNNDEMPAWRIVNGDSVADRIQSHYLREHVRLLTGS